MLVHPGLPPDDKPPFPPPRHACSFGEIAKQSTTLLLPANTSDPASMVASALSIYKQVSASGGPTSPSSGGGAKQQAAQGGRQQDVSSRPAAAAAPAAAPQAAREEPVPPRTPRFSLQHALQ